MIGTRLCEKLIEKNYTVIGADQKLNQWNSSIDLQSIKIDLRDKGKVLDLLPRNIDLIIHLAANARVYNLVIDPSQARDNFELTFNILEFARIHNVKRVIFSSSREVYGNSNYFIRAEDPVDIKSCESPYAATKVAGEAIFWAYARCYGIDFIIFRFSNVYGMYDDTDRVVPLFLKRAAQGKSLTVFGKDKVVDFTYIDDTIMAIINGIDRFDHVKNQVFNIAGSNGVRLLTVAELVKSKLNSDSVLFSKKTGLEK